MSAACVSPAHKKGDLAAWLSRSEYYSAKQDTECARKCQHLPIYRSAFPTFHPLLEHQTANPWGRLSMVKCATMPSAITHRPLRRPGRKPTKPPAGALEQVRELAADGWSIVGISHRLGADPKTFKLWLEREPALQDAFDLGREQERQTLHNMLYRKAVEKGDTTAAMCLLNSRHGYRSDQGDQGNRVAVQINLPGPMTLEQFRAISTKGADNGQG